MKCVITGVNIKVFARSIHSLARIGDELYVEPDLEGISFCTVNSSRSAFASFKFGRSFFSQCESGIDGSAPSTSQSNSSQSDAETIKYKVAMRAFLGAFKSLASVEKTVERCKIVVDDAAAKVIVQLVCRYSVVRNYHLPFIECETLRAVYDEASCPYAVTSPSRLLSDVVVNFQPGQDEVSLKVTPTSACVRNYVDDEPDLSKVIRTELQLESDEFDAYGVEAEGEVVFNLKELRAILGFSEPCNLPVTARFSQPGSPIIFSVDNKPLFESKFVLATLTSPQAPESQAGVSGTAAAAASALKNRNSTKKQALQPSERSEHHVVEHHVDDARHEQSTSKNSTRKNDDLRRSNERSVNVDTNDVDNDDIPLMTRLSESPPHSATIDFRRSIDDHSNLRNNDQSSRYPPDHRVSPVHNSTHIRECSANQSQNVICNDAQENEVDAGIKIWELNCNGNNELGTVFEADECPSPDVNRIPSPPKKKRRKHFLFYRCFNSTYNAHDITSYDDVLAPDSDPED
ncbi:Rad9/Ddc1 [Trinorchestia longiramus]|nr:Rad9/Ddc1 [Trinorchestia longiramus]